MSEISSEPSPHSTDTSSPLPESGGMTHDELRAENDQLQSENQRLVGKIALLEEQMAQREEQVVQLEAKAGRDPDTNLFRRNAFLARVENIVAENPERKFAIARIDVKNFKRINDYLGHDAGDTAILDITQFLDTHVRNRDDLARPGGDEFAILVDLTPRQTIYQTHELEPVDPSSISETAEGVMAAFAQRLESSFFGDYLAAHPAQQLLGVRLSVGTAVHEQGDNILDTWKRADFDSYRHKREQTEGK